MSTKTRKKTLKKSSKTPVGKSAKARTTAAAKKPAAKKRSAAVNKQLPTVTRKSKTATKTATKPVTKPAAKTAAKTVAKAVTAGNAALAEGAKAPAFNLPRDGGDTVSLADFAGRKLVLFFYPRANTPGCTREAIDFTRLAGAFADAGTAVLGVSADPLKAQEAFRDKHDLAVPLISDERHEMLKSYGAWGEKSMYGKIFLGVLRTTVLIGADGRVIRIWRQVKVDGHADEVLAAAQAA